MEEERIEEINVRLVGRTGGGYGSASAQWVDGSEVDSESPPWSLLDENDSRESRDGYGSVRRRLVKKLKRVDSFDVEAMEIVGFQDHHAKSQSLLVTARSTVKIGDFSVSQVFEDNNDELRRSPGTPVFTAPECCLGLTYGGKAVDT